MAKDYLKILLSDLTKKQESIARYQKRGKENLLKVHQVTLQWISHLEKKDDIIDRFRKSRDRIAPSHFAVEKAPGGQAPDQNAEDVKKVEQAIKDSADQLAYLYQETSKDLQVETQLFAELQDLTQKINEQFDNIYSGQV